MRLPLLLPGLTKTNNNRSEDVYNDLRLCLLERVNDKEAPVRVQAVIALSKLCGSEDPSEEPNITDVLVDTLSYDSSA